MGFEAFAFYAFAAVAVVSAFCVVTLRNPVHSVLFLILTFVAAAGLFVMLAAEFLAMLLVVVYVGAVAVLFLFVVMMLDVNFAELRRGFARYLPLGAVVGGVLVAQLLLVAAAWQAPLGAGVRPAQPEGVTNAEAIGRVLYTDYIALFQLSGLVLFVAMIGAVVLTLRHREGVKRQDVAAQVGRSRKRAVRLVDVKPGAGLGG